MSRQFQDFTVPLAASRHTPSHRLVVTANRHPVSREEFLDDVNLPEDVMYVLPSDTHLHRGGGGGQESFSLVDLYSGPW